MLNKINFSSIYSKGVISLFKGSLWAQIIGLIGTLGIAKLYGPDFLGVFSKFMSLSSILAIFFTLRLESAFVLTNDENKLKTIFSSIIYTIITGGVIILLLILTFPESFFLKINFLRIYIVFCILGAVLKSIESAYLSYLLRQKKFKDIALSRIIFTIIRYLFQIGLFFFLPEIGLLLGFIITSLIILLFYYKKTGNLFLRISFNEFKETLSSNINLVSYGVISDNLNAVNLHIIPLLAGIYFSDTEIGWYFLATVLLSVPVSFISSSFSKVFFLKASEIYNENSQKLFLFLKNYTIRLSLSLLVPFLLFFLFSESFILIFLEEKWIKVGLYIQLLSFLFYFRAIYNPISYLEEVLKKNHVGLLFNISLILGNLMAVYIGYLEQSFMSTIKIISYLFPICYLIMISYFLITTYQLRFKKF